MPSSRSGELGGLVPTDGGGRRSFSALAIANTFVRLRVSARPAAVKVIWKLADALDTSPSALFERAEGVIAGRG